MSRMTSRQGTIVLAGSLAQKPHQGGHTWVFLQYLLGFKRLGWDVLFLDRLEPDMCVDPSDNLRYLRDVMQAFGLADHYAVACNGGTQFVGLSREAVLARVKQSDTFINVMGFFSDPEILAAARHRVFFDIDPGFGQMWRALGWHDPYHGYDRHLTVGERVGQPACVVPTCGIDWVTTRQPIVLEQWPVAPRTPDGRFTSIGAWRGPYAPIEFQGKTYGLRAHEFRKFAELPSLTRESSRESFEVALDIHAEETRDLALLSSHLWHLADPRTIAHGPAAYRAYIAGSKAEFMVAKNMYVQTQSGWFSDRSICYLASGKPVLAQDTGLTGLYPLGHGLLTFSTFEEARAGVDDISARYEHHCEAARDIAQEYFDSDRVLTQLVRTLAL